MTAVIQLERNGACLAAEAPSKRLVPLINFILAVTSIVLAFPPVMKFPAQRGL